MNFWKKHWSTIVLIVIMLTGLSLLLYPTVSDYWNSLHQSRAISKYAEAVANISNEEYDRLIAEADIYNREFAKRPFQLQLTAEEMEKYEKQLVIEGSGIMSYIDIPSIKCFLPIYHGTEEQILQVAIGHLPGTSLPVGGESSHCVLSGHRGLPSAKLFTDLDKLIVGDTFMIRTLDEVLTYEVDQILIVLPDETEALAIEKGKDLCTLVTCTPYGVNSHRLLVRGHRIDTVNTQEIRVTADAQQIEPIMVAPVVAAPILLVLLMILLITTRRKK